MISLTVLMNVSNMKITCALSPAQLEKLYKLVYKNIITAVEKGDKTFDPEAYMQDLFNRTAERSSEDNAAKFIQQVPLILASINATPKVFRSGITFPKDFDLRELDARYTDAEKGIGEILNDFGSSNKDDLRLKSLTSDRNQFEPTQGEDEEQKIPSAPRLTSFNPNTGTLIEFQPTKTSEKEKDLLFQESLNQNRSTIYTTINRLRDAVDPTTQLVTDLVYQNRTLKLKAVPLESIDPDLLDDTTLKAIERSQVMKAKKQTQANVVQTDNIVALVVIDAKTGEYVKFDETGDITENVEGKIVYQFLRPIAQTADGKYVVTDFFTKERRIAKPEVVAERSYFDEMGITKEEYIKQVDKEQQEDFKKIEELRRRALAGEDIRLSIVNVTDGVAPGLTGIRININRINENYYGDLSWDKIFKTVNILKKKENGASEGSAVVEIKGNKYTLDRIDIPKDKSRELSYVLTNPNIPFETRLRFYQQFFGDKMADTVVSHKIAYNPDTKEFKISLYKETYTQNKNRVEPKPIDISNAALLKRTPEQLEALRFNIEKRINEGKSSLAGTTFPAKMGYSSDLFKGKLPFFTYNVDTEEFTPASYVDFITSLNPQVDTSLQGTESFNAAIVFNMPSAIEGMIEKTNEELAKEKTDPELSAKQNKDDLVSYLKSVGDAETVIVNSVNITENKKGSTLTFESPSNGSLITVGLDFEAIDKNLIPSVNDVITLGMTTVETDAIYVEDVIEVFSNENSIGYVRETSTPQERLERETVYRQRKQEILAQRLAEEKEKLNPTNVTQPSDAATKTGKKAKIDPNKFTGLDRSNLLDNGVTEAQLAAAEKWWPSHPMSKVISLDHLTNIVNSNAFARFTVAAKNLNDPTLLGKISLFKGGSLVDIYHESWHAFSQLYLTREEKINLYEEVRRTTPKLADATYLEIEEELAEDFRSYAKNQSVKKNSPVRNSLFRRILNFLRTLFGNKPASQEASNNLSDNTVVKELYDKLFFASENPNLLNDYTPLIDNVMFDLLNRGPQRVDNRKEQALSKADADLAVSSTDSIMSEYIDDIHDMRKDAGGTSLKSGSIALFSSQAGEDGITNKERLYEYAKNAFEEQLDYWRNELGEVSKAKFNTLKTEEELEKNAIGIMKSDKGRHKYFFLTSQVENFENLNPELRRGQRVKGQAYFNIDIVGDFYSHKSIKIGDEPVDIVLVSDVRDAQIQYDNYIKGGAQEFTSFEQKDQPALTPLTPEKQAIQNKVRLIEKTLENWGDANTGFVKYHMENSDFDIVKETFVEVEYDDEGVEQDETSPEDGKGSDDTFNDKTGKISLEKLANKETIYLLKSLFKIDRKTGKTIKDPLGFKQRADYREVWNSVVRAMGGEKDRVKAYEKLKAAVAHTPELQQLIEKKFPAPERITNTYEFNISGSFWQTFSRPRVPYIQLTAYMNVVEDPFSGYQQIGSINTEVTTASVEVSSTLRKFENKYKTDLNNNFVVRTVNNETLLKVQDVVKEFGNKKTAELNTASLFNFARSIGFYLDDLISIKQELKNNKNKYGLEYLYDVVKELGKIEAAGVNASEQQSKKLLEFKRNPIKVLSSEIPAGILGGPFTGKSVNMTSNVKRLAELQIELGVDSSNYSVFSADRNKVFEFINDHSISRMVDAINSAENLGELFTGTKFQYMNFLDWNKNTFTKKSQIIRSLFDFTDPEYAKRQGRTLKLFNDSGTQAIINENGKTEFFTGTNTTAQDINGKFIQELHMLLKGGVQEFIRHASKKTAQGVKIDGGIIGGIEKGIDPNLYVDINMFGPEGNGTNYAFNQIILPYITVEFDRIQKFKANKEKYLNYLGYNTRVGGTKQNPIYSGEVFTAFDNVLTKSVKEKLYNLPQGTDLAAYLRTNPNLRLEIQRDVEAYFKQQTLENIDMLEQNKFIDKTLFEKIGIPIPANETKEQRLTREKEGEAILVKAYTYNSWIHNFETIHLFYGDMAQFNHIKEELHKRNTGSTSGGIKFLADEYAQSFINENFNINTYGAKLAKQLNNKAYNSFHFDGTLNTAVIQDIERESIYSKEIEEALREDYTESLKGFNYSKAQVKEIVDKRIKEEMKAYKKMTEGDGAGYITLDAYRTLKKLSNEWTDDVQEKIYQDIINGRPVKATDVKEFFPVYKLQYFGNIDTGKDNLPVTAMHKFALTPLIPSVFKGTELEKMHKEMLRNNIQYLTFQSGSKVSGITSDGKADNIYKDDTKKELKDVMEFTPNRIYVEYLKDVTKVNNKYKDTITYPTQLRGLLLDGIYNEGNIIDEVFKKPAEDYKGAVDKYSQLLRIELLNEIGYSYNEKTGKYTGNLGDFLEMVQKELDKRDIPEQLIKFIGVNLDKSLRTDLSLHLEADSIEKILLSIIQKRLIKQKVKGEAFIQIPSSMTNGAWGSKFELATDDDIKKYMGSNTLPFYKRNKGGKTSAMKVAVALQGDFLNLLKLKYKDQVIGDINTLNEAIKDDEWLDKHREAVTLAGARIPIQNLNSMEFAEVYHFLDPTAGNMIIVPTEIVAKAGSDFDVDKIFFSLPHIDVKGNFINAELTNEELEKKIKAAKKPKEKAAVKALIKKQKQALENNLISTTRGILEVDKNYSNLVRPNATYLMQDMVEFLEDYVVDYSRYNTMHGEGIRMFTDNDGKQKRVISPTRTLEAKYNLQKHQVNMVGKDTLGIVALENKQHPIWKSIMAKMPTAYKEAVWDNSLGKYVEIPEIDKEMILRLDHNNIGYNISLSSMYSKDGDRISDLISHMMNGLLDVEKDPWVFFIQANLEQIPVINYLLQAGVPKKQAIFFAAQPAVREYAKAQRRLKSTFAAFGSLTPVNEAVIPSQAAKEVYEKYFASTELGEDARDMRLQQVFDNFKDKTVIISYSLQGKNLKYKGTPAKFEQAYKNYNQNDKNKSKIFISDISEPETDRILYQPSTNPTASSNIYYSSLLVNGKKDFSEEELYNNIKNNNFDLGSFLHFLEIEQQIKGIQAAKRQANPDTKLVKTAFQINKQEIAYQDVVDSSKVDNDLPVAIKERSILSSFYASNLTKDLVTPVFPLRLNPVINDFISDQLRFDSQRIKKKFGAGVDGQEKFTSNYNNGVVNYIFQNYLSNYIDDKGKAVILPDVHREMTVINAPFKEGDNEYFIHVDKNAKTINVDLEELKDIYDNKLFLRSNNEEGSYNELGLYSFIDANNPFDTFESFVRYTLEEAHLRSIYTPEQLKGDKTYGRYESLVKKSKKEIDQSEIDTKAFNAYISQRALMNVYNPNAIMKTPNFSYSDQVMSVIEDYQGTSLLDTYPVLNQLEIAEFPAKRGIKLITLKDKSLVDGDVAFGYYQQLRQLGNINIRKVNDPIENKRISDLFKVFTNMMIYQHGIGYSPYGFPKVLDPDPFVEVMRNASARFMEGNLNLRTLSSIYVTTISNRPDEKYFKSYIETVENFNTGTSEIDNSSENPDEIEIKPTQTPVGTDKFSKKNIFTVTPIQAADKKAVIKASIATQFIGFGEGIIGKDGKTSSTQLYREQAGSLANTGNYSTNDVIFVSVPGLRGNAEIAKREQDKTIKEAIKAVEAGATILTDNKAYIDSSKYNTGEQRLYKNMESKGYNYSEVTVDGQVIGTWSKATTQPVEPAKGGTISSTIYELNPNITEEEIKKIYDNYVALMNLRREGKQISYKTFKSLLDSYQVYQYKDTYIFGQYDNRNAVFITRLNSSPTSKELLAEAIPNLVSKGLDFMSFVPKDYADKLVRSGYTSSTKSYDYNFKGEKMKKFAVASNPIIFQKVFNKKFDELTSEEIEEYTDSIDLKYKPVEINADLISQAGNDLSKILETYLNQFGIRVDDINVIKEKMGIDEVGFADLLSKVAYVKDKKDLPPIAGEFIAYMMQYNPLVQSIINDLIQTNAILIPKNSYTFNEQGNKVYNYKSLDKTEFFKYIGNLISEDLQNKLEGNYNKSLIQKIKDLIKTFFDYITKTQVDRINTNVGIISNNILQQNKKMITASLYKPGAFGQPTQQVDIESALKQDEFGASIIYSLAKEGFILTGSTALSEQGTILRPDENPLHDIDWVSPFNRKETEEKFLSVYPDAVKVRDIYGEGYITDSYLIAPDGYSVANYKADDFNGKIIINSYDIVDKNGIVVGTYRLEKQENNNQMQEVVRGIEGKVIDFFSYENYGEFNKGEAFPYTSKQGTVIKLANWKDIFNAKLAWARYKDIWDYNRFIPNENIVKITGNQPGARLSSYDNQNAPEGLPPIDRTSPTCGG